ncbi:AraC family transcriptional regulator [Actinomycetospora sp. C-140]
MPDTASRRIVRSDVQSADPEFAHEVLRECYTDFTVTCSGDAADFRFALTRLAGAEVAVGRLRYGMTVTMAVPAPEDVVVAATCLDGTVAVDDGREVVGARPGTPALLPVRHGYDVHASDVTVETVSFAASALDRTAASILGIEAPLVRFTSMTPVSPAAVRYWNGVVAHVREVLGDDALTASPLVLGEATRALATAALLAYPNTGLAGLAGLAGLDGLDDVRGGGRAEPAVLRRALDHIDVHAGEDIGVDDIAAAARIGVRGLQHLFRRHRDTTPLQHLRHVRMERAHAELRSADPTRGATVGATAARWGFANPGRFAVEYRRVYGRSPGEILRS